MLRSSLRLLVATWLTVMASWEVRAEDSPASKAAVAFFESKIRPVLVERCYECHAGENVESGLRLDTQQALRKGGERGPAVVPYKPEASLLLAAILHEDEALAMPPKGEKLSKAIIGDFRRWIEMGAPDPRTHAKTASLDVDSGQGYSSHWAYQPLKQTSVPKVSSASWPRGWVDLFILASLDSNGLKPTADAEPRTLLRRLHFDLGGLPPSPEATTKFLADVDANGFEIALEAEVDRLLDSPRFGERWGRHWLDVARYGESSGGESNVSFPYAWRYRDYVIDAFNADLGFDRFLTEQLAGDLLPFESPEERARLLIATGFLAVGTKNLGENNDKQFQADLIDEQIDSLSRAVLGSSIACARCHQHKFDPFSMEDYYGLAGIFASTQTYFGTFPSPANNRGGQPLRLPRDAAVPVLHRSVTLAKFKELTKSWEELTAERQAIEEATKARLSGRTPERTFTLREVLANLWRLGAVEGKLATLDEQGKAIPLAMGVLEAEKIVDAPLLARGDVQREGAIVPRGFPKALSPKGIAIPAASAPTDSTPADSISAVAKDVDAIPQDSSGRLEMAGWLTSDSHPLTSRVFVNRVWKQLFGKGLVATCDDFGTTGASPSHPQLLDNLAIEFMQNGWSVKPLIRSLVLSRSYRQASAFNQTAFEVDPENALLWRMPKRRLEAEAIRDAMLFVAGDLDASRPTGSLVGATIGDRPISLIGLDKRLPEDLDGMVHRSVYLPVIRDRLPDVLELFDFAEPSLVTGDREITNVPVQALYLMNSPFVYSRAQSLASRLDQETDNREEFVDRAFELCYARHPSAGERNRSLEFLESASETQGNASLDGEANAISFCQSLLATAEFRNVD